MKRMTLVLPGIMAGMSCFAATAGGMASANGQAGQRASTNASPEANVPAIPCYTNPNAAVSMGDPFALRHGGMYYLYATSAGDGFKAWRSKDLVNWTELGYVYRRTSNTWGTGSFWAPEVTHYRGKFYMVYSCNRERGGGFRLCIAVSDRPEGPFTDLHAPWCDNGWSCIDADLFIDDDGAPYLFFDKVGTVTNPVKYMYGMIYGMKLKPDLSGPAGEPVLCAQADHEWEDPLSTLSRCNEGAFVFTHGGRYYMTYSVSHYASPRYGIGYATAPAPLGPWTKAANNPLAVTDASIGVSGPGHNSVVSSPDGTELFMVYHTHANMERKGGRVLNIDRLVFGGEGELKLIGPTRAPQPYPSAASK
ncbi:family 43 glycosylhydrolase [bacterium]|nr:family 43 glycosylhydrolase [bacterium]